MSKMDGLRAMREARYAEAAKAAKTAKPAKPSSPVAATKVTGKAASGGDTTSPAAAETADAALCGHRAISGRTCTREHGHAAKSHRYS